MAALESDVASPAVKISLPLAFQQEIFNDVRAEDQLVILARGLGLLRIVTNLLHSYDAAEDNLVLVVGAWELETDWIGEALAEQNAISKAPKARGLNIITTDAMSVEGRRKTYARGGVFAVTSRILQVDLLTELLPLEKITGVVVLHAEKVTATSSEAFILRLYRQKNKDGFIKAFSDNPEPFTSGFAPLATMMRNLHLSMPTLWPRFHLSVAESLEIKKPEVIELNVTMTEAMQQIQTSILQCIETSLSEIKKGNSKELDVEDWNVESALHKMFDVIVRRQLDPVWHRVSWKTKQIVGDLKELREMLNYLVSYDSVSFYQYLEGILATQSTNSGGQGRQNQSPWLFLDAAQIIFNIAKNRAYSGNVNKSKVDNDDGGVYPELIPVLEEQPKWASLSAILDEIERDVHFNASFTDTSYGTVLVMCSDAKECRQLREYLQTVNRSVGGDYASDVTDKGGNDEEVKHTHSAAYMMRRRLRGYLTWKRDLARFKAVLNDMNNSSGISQAQVQKRQQEGFRGRTPANKRRRTRGGSSAGTTRATGATVQASEDPAAQVAELWQSLKLTEAEQNVKQEIAVDPLDDMEKYYGLFDLQNLVVVHPFKEDMDDRLLEELRPRYIIMYNPDTAFIRRVEVYRSSHNDRMVKVFFLYYGDSVEEQRFLSAVRKEKDAFSKLIREKGSMTVTLTTDIMEPDDSQEVFLRTINARVAGGGKLAATVEQPRVIVDIREFRSSLPSLLHGRRNNIVPVTLTVGDYILSPDICVERKSVKDLISSFKNGRLYTQCESMTQHYKQPMVLIEFEQNKSFNLEPFADLASGIGQNDLQSKMVLLAQAFPKVKFIWSSSPYQTAEIFEELKRGQEEPDPDKAVSIGLEEGEDATGNYSQTPQDMLRAVPGITSKNYKHILTDIENFTELSNMDEAEIRELIGAEAAKKVYRFLNRTF
ncbi:DNA repair protein [Wilcoxina mikolae CBS 423.85]|nr:DNA repair protein [Wilcoxina mikolae CBS 423.85]